MMAVLGLKPMAAYVSMSSAPRIGLMGGFICHVMYQVIHKKIKFDDALDVFSVTYALMFVVNRFLPGKITPEEEQGQDITEHDEVAYN